MSICSLVVHARPEATQDVRRAIEAEHDCCEVAAAEKGRLVVVIDTRDRARMSDTIMALNDITGVISVSLVFEYFEEDDRIGGADAREGRASQARASCETSG